MPHCDEFTLRAHVYLFSALERITEFSALRLHALDVITSRLTRCGGVTTLRMLCACCYSYSRDVLGLAHVSHRYVDLRQGVAVPIDVKACVIGGYPVEPLGQLLRCCAALCVNEAALVSAAAHHGVSSSDGGGGGGGSSGSGSGGGGPAAAARHLGGKVSVHTHLCLRPARDYGSGADAGWP
jgi:hypothetical protein